MDVHHPPLCTECVPCLLGARDRVGVSLAGRCCAISPSVLAAYAVHSYAFNFRAAVSFYRYGLLAPVLVRLAYYLVWHVGYGNFLAGL